MNFIIYNDHHDHMIIIINDHHHLCIIKYLTDLRQEETLAMWTSIETSLFTAWKMWLLCHTVHSQKPGL